MTLYKTKQRALLLEFFNAHPHDSFSALQISSHFAPEISTSAVYRNLAELESSGQIRKISKHGSREIFYQFTQARVCENQIHLVCEKCEKITHADSLISERLSSSLKKHAGFAIDKKTTIIYGVCEKCQTS